MTGQLEALRTQLEVAHVDLDRVEERIRDYAVSEGTPLDLTSAEFDLLEFLAQNAGRTLSRNDIYLKIHGTKYDGIDRSIDLRVSRLRKKLGDDPTRPRRIKSVRGVGYMLTVDK